ncbi:MAG: ribonuclease H-like YkuK family protein [bacterium]
MDGLFHNPTVGDCEGSEVLNEIVSYVNQEPHQAYQITVGTDSTQLHGHASFVSVVAVRRMGRGGRYFWQQFENDLYSNLRQRIYAEASHSLDLASDLSQHLEGRLQSLPDSFDFDVEIHVDIGENGPTHEMITEIVGMIRGHGYEVRTKPEAYCAAVVADKYA